MTTMGWSPMKARNMGPYCFFQPPYAKGGSLSRIVTALPSSHDGRGPGGTCSKCEQFAVRLYLRKLASHDTPAVISGTAAEHASCTVCSRP